MMAAAAAASSAGSNTVDIFVDPTKGSDAAAGSAGHPIASLTLAQQMARAATGRAGAHGTVTVHLAAGARFNLAEPAQGGGGLNLSSDDGGAVRWVGEGALGVRHFPGRFSPFRPY